MDKLIRKEVYSPLQRESMQTVLVVKDLTKSYHGIPAVQNLSFDIRKGEIFGLLGHNGAGKSTAIEAILGTKSFEKGYVEILGNDPKKHRKQVFEKVGVQFQQSSYPDKIRVDEMCAMTASLYHKPSDWIKLLISFGLEQMKKKQVSELSGGERQKLSVLLALIPDPELVFLDELTTGLDSKARREVWKHLAQLKGRGITILLTSHYMDEVEALCDRVCILKQGKAVVNDTIQGVIEKSPYQNLEESYLWYTGEEKEDESITIND